LKPGQSPEASTAFSEDEFETVCGVADGLTVYVGGRGWSAKPDLNFAGELVRFLGTTGVHVSEAGKLTTANLHANRLVLNRPKTHATVVVPLQHEVQGAVRSFLSKKRPRHRNTYFHIFKKIERAIEEREGVTIKVNGDRFRHYAGRHWLEMGIDPVQVSALLGTTVKTLEKHYGKSSPDAIEEALRERGW
jgi:site-specific recombinase XerD